MGVLERIPLRFVPVDKSNRMEIERLEVLPEQTGFIESVKECLAEADSMSEWRPVGIYCGNVPVGFAMYGFFASEQFGRLWLDRILIDKRFQGRGYGRAAVTGLLERLKAEYETDTVFLSVYEQNSTAVSLYEQNGFRFNGEYDTKGEKIMIYFFE